MLVRARRVMLLRMKPRVSGIVDSMLMRFCRAFVKVVGKLRRICLVRS